MRVDLIFSYCSEQMAELAASMCVGNFGTSKHSTKGLQVAIESGHLSLLEHLPMTFVISDISRACSHQLVRHRIGWSYSQVSQRYTKLDSKNAFCLIEGKYPNSYFKALESHLEHTKKLYDELIAAGIKPEDARAILPNCTATSLIATTNARALITACHERLCSKAQEEIREVFHLMKEQVKDIYPSVYKLCVPKCIRDGKCKETKSCKGVK